MTDHESMRSCALLELGLKPEGRLLSLWETEPEVQAAMREWVSIDQAIDQAIVLEGHIYDLVWRDFPTRTAVEAANAALHHERWLEDIEDDFREPECWGTIAPTW
jgi:hypothetical protein